MVKMLRELRLKAGEIKKFVDVEALNEQEQENLSFDVNTPLTDAILAVLHSKRGRRPMTLGQITEALKQGGAFYASTSISSVLTSLAERDKIRRWKEHGKYLHLRAGDPEVK